MNGDFDRMTFDAGARFASVLAQQGRTLLPADLNEQTAIHHHYLRSLVADLQGSRWRPADGFNVIATDDVLLLSAGHFYVDGILCENDVVCDLTDQPFGPTPDSFDDLAQETKPLAFYLDCWERHITWFQYPRLREVALGGPDTATRLQIAWQVRPLVIGTASPQLKKVLEAMDARLATNLPAAEQTALTAKRTAVDKLFTNIKNGLTAPTAQDIVDAFGAAPPRLAAAAHDKGASTEPCALEPSAAYRGRENQLYRVEVHRGGLATGPARATFKWSRENGSVALLVIDIDIDAQANLTRVTVDSLGRDRRTGVCEGQWVELTDRASELKQEAAPLLRVQAIDVHRKLITLAGKASSSLDANDQAILRRWDHVGNEAADGALLIEESATEGWIELERGLRVRFDIGGYYTHGACWMIPARVGTRALDWQMNGKVPRAIEPHGPKHHRAAITIATRTAGAWKLEQPKGLK